MSNLEETVAVTSVACPHCHATPGAPCLGVLRSHRARYEALASAGEDVERVALAITQSIGWGTFSHFEPGDVRKIAHAAIAAMSPSTHDELVEALKGGLADRLYKAALNFDARPHNAQFIADVQAAADFLTKMGEKL